MHTEATLTQLEQVTMALWHLMRDFQDKTCAKFNTTELAREVEAQNCCDARTNAPNQSRKLKTFNLLTYKFHDLGDYVCTIRMFGTTDSFSTQPVCASASQVHQSPNSALVSRTVFSRTFSIVLWPSRDIPACSRPLSVCLLAIPIRSVSFRCLLICSVIHPFRVFRLYLVSTRFLSVFHIRIRP